MSLERSNPNFFGEFFLFIFYEERPTACSHAVDLLIHTDVSRVSYPANALADPCLPARTHPTKLRGKAPFLAGPN